MERIKSKTILLFGKVLRAYNFTITTMRIPMYRLKGHRSFARNFFFLMLWNVLKIIGIKKLGRLFFTAHLTILVKFILNSIHNIFN